MRRVNTSPVQWTVVINDVTSLRNVVDACAAVMKRMTFRITHQDGRDYLCVDGHDQVCSCFISAVIETEPRAGATPTAAIDEELTFCLNVKDMQIAIDSPTNSHGVVTLERTENNVRVKMSHPEMPVHEMSSVLNLVEEEEQSTLDSIEFSFKLEFELGRFKDFLRRAGKTDSEKFSITVYMEPGTSPYRKSVVSWSSEGSMFQQDMFFYSAKQEEDGSMVVRHAADGTDADASSVTSRDLLDKYEVVYSHSFSLKTIENFTKTLKQRNLNAMLAKDTPIMFAYNLGGVTDESQYVRFLVSPLNEDYLDL